MIAGFLELLDGARRRGTAVAAFTCYDAESAAGVLRAADGRPVIVLVSARLAVGPAGDLMVAALRGMAERARSPVCLQLDHAHDMTAIAAGCELGVGAVMADGSHLSPQANASFVLAARGLARPLGIAVEAQLGRIAGDEEVTLSSTAEELTDPGEAAEFSRETGVDCLGVAIGNVHGDYRAPAQLDVVRLRRLATAVRAPLALHGATGLAPSAVRGAVRAGIAKVNVNTAIRRAYLRRTADLLPASLDGSRLLDLHRGQLLAVEAEAAQRLATVEEGEPPPVTVGERGRGDRGDGGNGP